MGEGGLSGDLEQALPLKLCVVIARGEPSIAARHRRYDIFHS